MLRFPSLPKRVEAYHPRLDKGIFGGALLGVLIVTHLAIQNSRNFDRGCFGFSGLDAGRLAFDCSAVVSSGGGTFLGLSNITWGLGFYLAVALLTFVVFWGGAIWRRWAHGARATMLAGGVLYSGYLVYLQVGVIGALCALCLLSATLAGLLFGTQVAILTLDVQSTVTTMTSRFFKRDLTVYVYLVALMAVFIGADLTYFGTLAPADEERAAAHNEQFGGAACRLDTSKEAVPKKGAPLVGFQDITKGPSDASVTVIEYFDPNCPHCKTFHGTMKKVVSEFGEDVRFVYKPFPLGASSLPEVQALYVAQQENKFTEMLEAQYARQSRSGISKRDLRDIASAIGMNPDVLMSRINQNKYRKQIIAQRRKAIEVGVDSTPTVLVNGHFLGSRSYECLSMFIERAKEGKLGATGASS
jgi:uncharacterized membrane protein/predicted DsbA family dithiol-disulfide isomerase